MPAEIPPCAACGSPVRLKPTTLRVPGRLMLTSGEPIRECTDAACETRKPQQYFGGKSGKA